MSPTTYESILYFHLVRERWYTQITVCRQYIKAVSLGVVDTQKAWNPSQWAVKTPEHRQTRMARQHPTANGDGKAKDCPALKGMSALDFEAIASAGPAESGPYSNAPLRAPSQAIHEGFVSGQEYLDLILLQSDVRSAI